MSLCHRRGADAVAVRERIALRIHAAVDTRVHGLLRRRESSAGAVVAEGVAEPDLCVFVFRAKATNRMLNPLLPFRRDQKEAKPQVNSSQLTLAEPCRL